MCCSVLQCVAERCIESDYRERVRIEVELNRGGSKNPFAKVAAIKAGDLEMPTWISDTHRFVDRYL